MEKNYSSTDPSASFDRTLSSPHFDEDATLVSARPVIALNEIKVETRSQRRVIIGLTILAAILLGAIGATLLMQRGQNSQGVAETEVSQPTVSSSGAAGGSTSEPAEARVPAAREPDEELQIEKVPIAHDSSTKKRQAAALSQTPIRPTVSRNSRQPVRDGNRDYERNEDFESDERELRRAERREARREARRQHRLRGEQGDDLLRIREIFEGSPRP